MQLPPSESLDNLLEGLSWDKWDPEGMAMHSPGHHDMDLDRGAHSAPVLVKVEEAQHASAWTPAANLFQQTLRLQAEAPPGPWPATPPAPGSTLNPQQIEFASLLRQAGMTGLSDDDIRHLYAVSEVYAMQAASTGQPLPVGGVPPPMVPLGGPLDVPLGGDAHVYAGAGTCHPMTHHPEGVFPGGGAPTQPAQQQPGAKRRGRRPADTANLTQKQLRAREAQKRFRDKQKSRMQETEETVTQLARELQEATLVNDTSSKKQVILERLLEYKDEQVEALEWHKALVPPPGIIISPEIVEIVRARTVPGIYTPEMLLRYHPAGYKENLDERGYVKEAPPFEKCCEDWHEVVMGLQNLLDAALVGGGRVHNREGMLGAENCIAMGEHREGAVPPRFQEVVTDEDGTPMLMTSTASSSVAAPTATTTSTSGGGAISGLTDGSQSSNSGPESQQGTSSPAASSPPQMIAILSQDTALHVNTQDPRASHLWDSIARTLVDAAQSGGPDDGSYYSSDELSPTSRDEDDDAGHHVAGNSDAFENALGANDASKPIKTNTSRKGESARQMKSSALASRNSMLALPDGVVIHHGADTYHFTKQAYRSAGVLLRRMGLLSWQQAVLFPDNAMKLTAVRGDTGKADAQEAQDVGTWRAILRKLCLRPEQLRAIVAAHREFLGQEQEVLKHRAQMLAALRNPTFASASGRSQSSYLPHMMAAMEATQGLMKGMQVEHAASCAFSAAILRCLDFPVQKALLFTLSWPYYPQHNIIGTCAALELGLSLDEYVSMPLPPLPEGAFHATPPVAAPNGANNYNQQQRAFADAQKYSGGYGASSSSQPGAVGSTRLTELQQAQLSSVD